MTSLRHKLIPDEWQSAYASARELFGEVSRTSNFGKKHFVAPAILFSIGAAAGYGISSVLAPTSSAAMVRGVLTLVAILSGFMITLMLFTGRLDAADRLSLEEARAYADKVIYLLWSQTMTLLTHLGTGVVAVVWLFLINVTGAWFQHWAGAMMFGMLSMSLIRTLLLPMQIYELHRFGLDLIIQEKERAVREKVRQRHTA